jgi:RluA family pseudouridine synthase
VSCKRLEADLYVETDYRILYEDASFIVIDKPSPLPVHPVGSFQEKNLLSLLKKESAYQDLPLRIVNRLDSETSGVLLVAKSKEAASGLAQQFEKRTVTKEYTGIVFGIFLEKKGKISFPLGSRITEEGYHLRTVDPEGETAETLYEVISENDKHSLVRLVPFTGRTHQIRAHLAFAGHPLVGDKIYIDNDIYHQYVQMGWQEEMLETVKLRRLALHASRLKVKHPATGSSMEFEAPIPEIFTEFLKN